ncbi:hypothetical protein E6H18_11955 [Candidatus Bathyarchaeota archaeon]|nr:MAG: hypothetical protein E6H18_11955 [Candidatus Bathyarchaeota archaeon]
MPVDSVSLLISSVGILGGIIIVYLLRNQKRKVAFGFGGSIILLGLILLAIAYKSRLIVRRHPFFRDHESHPRRQLLILHHYEGRIQFKQLASNEVFAQA